MHKLFKEAERLGVQVRKADLGGNLLGYYSSQGKIVIIDQELIHCQARSVLAHELGHAYYNHDCTKSEYENQANRYAAQLLISIQEYIQAEKLWANDIYRIAQELNVTTELVVSFQKLLLSQYLLERRIDEHLQFVI